MSKGARPLVVDWKPDQRGDLEVAMKDGIAIVRYSCEGIELLADCRIDGGYGFKGVVLKQQLVRLKSADEVRANLPLTGLSLAVQLEAEFSRGISLDLATALIGKQTASRLRVGKPELSGRCDGATHFVRAAHIGAFVLQTGSAAEVSTAAELFGAGAAARSESAQMTRNADGDLAACKLSTSNGESPPDRCQSLVRVQLLPIDAETPVAPLNTEAASAGVGPQPRHDDVTLDCPAGLVDSEGKCTERGAAERHVCSPGSLSECQMQCEKGEAASCSFAGRALLKSHGGNPAVFALFTKSCQLGYPAGCSNLGVLTAADGTDKSEERAALLFEQACKGGDATGCFNLALMSETGRGVRKDIARAVALYRQACDAGKAAGCVNLGHAYELGDGVEKHLQKAFALFKRACEGEAAAGCTSQAFFTGEGLGTTANQQAAAELYERGCRLGSPQSCESLGNRLLSGTGVARNPEKGERLRIMACDLGRKSACEQPK